MHTGHQGTGILKINGFLYNRRRVRIEIGQQPVCSIFSDKISKVIMEDAPVSYKFCAQSDFFGMGFFIPGILKWGDIPLACAMTKAELEWITPRNQDGTPAEIPEKEIRLLRGRF